MQEKIYINHVISGSLKKIIEQANSKVLQSITTEEFHLVENFHHSLYEKAVDLQKKRYIQRFEELISKKKVKQNATNITDKKKWVINMSQPISKIFLQRALSSLLLLKLPNKDTTATIEKM